MGLEPLIIFLHIPKTAGITIRKHILVRQYSQGQMVESGWHKMEHADGLRSVGVLSDEFGSAGLFDAIREPGVTWYPDSLDAAARCFLRIPENLRAQLRLYYGKHIEYGLHEYISQPVEYFTMLRHPVERVLSHYYFSRERRVVPEGASLDEHIRAHVEENLQTRLMAGPPDPTGPLPAEEMLARAKRNLRACAIVGLTERFDESVVMMRKKFGWRMPFYVRANVGQNRPPNDALPPDVLRQIEADNALDMALYAEAQEIFEAQVEQYGRAALARDLRIFRFLNRWWQRWNKNREAWQANLSTWDKRVIEPAYQSLARSGALRRVLPKRFAPRVAAAVEGNILYFDLRVGGRIVGNYDPKAQRWNIKRPYRLFVDENTLPGVTGSRRQEKG